MSDERSAEFDPQPLPRVDDRNAVAGSDGAKPGHDPVNHPKHYTGHPSGIECITITEHMNFNLGNAVKYVWRADLKSDAIEDLRKAVWYLNREITKREKENVNV